MKNLFLFFLLNISFTAVYGQITDPDESLKQARTLAFEGKKEESIVLLNQIVEKYPNYVDVRMFLANVYTWNKQYNKAREVYEYLISKDEKNKEYWTGIIKNEYYADNLVKAMTYCFQGLNVYPLDPEITILKAKVQNAQSKPFEALKTTKDYLKENPKDSLVKAYQSSLKNDIATNTISISTGLDVFSDVFDPMRYYYLSYAKETNKGTVVARYNLNKKFETYGSQFEIDAYPSLGKGMYAYLNLGYSKSFIFPDWRYGAQIYRNLPKAFDASIGFRTLRFGKNNVNIYTGSLGKYFGNSYVFFVPYLIPSDEGWSKSGSFTYRKYGANEDQYFGIRVSAGFSPEINRFGTDVLTNKIISLKAQSINLAYNFKVKNNRNLIGTNLGLEHQESIFDPGIYYWITSLRCSYSLSY